MCHVCLDGVDAFGCFWLLRSCRLLLEQLKEPCGCGATVVARSTMDRGRREGGGRCMFVGAAVISSFVFIVSREGNRSQGHNDPFVLGQYYEQHERSSPTIFQNKT
jgi:hypothetical protein